MNGIVTHLSSALHKAAEGVVQLESLTRRAVESLWDPAASQRIHFYCAVPTFAVAAGWRGPWDDADHHLASGENRLKAWRIAFLMLGVGVARRLFDGYCNWRETGSNLSFAFQPLEVIKERHRALLVYTVSTTLDTLAFSSTVLNLCRWTEDGRPADPTNTFVTAAGMIWLTYRLLDINHCNGNTSRELIQSWFTGLQPILDEIAEKACLGIELSDETLGILHSIPWHANSRLVRCCALTGPFLLGGGITWLCGLFEEENDHHYSAPQILTIAASALANYYLYETRNLFFPLTTEMVQTIAAKSIVSTLDAFASLGIFHAYVEEDQEAIRPVELSMASAWLLYRFVEISFLQGDSSTQLMMGNMGPTRALGKEILAWLPEV